MEKDIISYIHEKMPEFSKGQRAIARYILSDYDKAVFFTAGKLGKEAGVSESTVVRFAMALGYDGYPEFQQSMAEYVKAKLNTINKIDIKNQDFSQGELTDYVMNGDVIKIQDTLKNLDRKAFDFAVEAVLSAEHVYIVGLRSCSALARFLGFYLNMIVPDVRVVDSNNSSEIFEQMIRVNSSDVVIGISFPRYSMRTLKALEFASSRSAKIITMTDSSYSPLVMYSSCNLYARSDMASVADSLTAPMSLINALIMALCVKRKDSVISNIETLENVWKDYIYDDADEIDMLKYDVADNLERLEKEIE